MILSPIKRLLGLVIFLTIFTIEFGLFPVALSSQLSSKELDTLIDTLKSNSLYKMEIISRSYSTTTSSPVDPKMFDDMVKYVELNFNSIGINKCDIEIDNKISNVLYDYLSKSNPEPSNRAVNLFWLVKLYGKDNNNYIFYLGRSYTNRSKSDIVINGNHIKIDKVFVQWFENNIDMSKCELNH